MAHAAGPSLISLLHRAAVLAGLIAGAVAIYLRLTLHTRGWWRGSPAALVERQRRFARRFVAAAVRFRGALIKLGQVASLRVDVMPEEVTDELARLQDRVDPHPFAEIAERIRLELSQPVDRVFAEFEETPIAAASLGQVHRARALDGRRLAVKVLYPGIERSVAVDLAMTRLALWLFDFITIGDLMQVYRELRDSLLGEMDYVREGRAAEEVARNLARDPELWSHVRLPRIYWDLTTTRVLSMEFLDGEKINDTAAIAALGVDLDQVVLWSTRAFLHMMFRDGFFHCDPHPGNLLVDADGRIGIIDFGMNRRIDAKVLAAVRRNVVSAVTRDVDAYAESLLAADMVDREDLPVVREIAKMAFDPAYYNLTPQEMANLDLGEYVLRARGHLKQLRSFRLPDGIVMWSRAISVLYGLVVELAPGLRPLDVLGPYVMEFLQGGPVPPPVNLPGPGASNHS